MMQRRRVFRRKQTPTEVPTSAAADAAMQLAVLLRAGVAPQRAWAFLADSGDNVARCVCEAAGVGQSLPAAIAQCAPDWREVGDTWTVAATVGAPLADTLNEIARALRDGHEASDDLRVVLAEPAATARLMSWLPLVGVALGVALGFDMTALFVHPVGITALIFGILLIFTAHRWTRSLVTRAQPEPGVPGFAADLLSVALSGGASIDRARQLLADTGRALDAESERMLELSQSAGAPAVDLLRASGAMARHRFRIAGRLRAAQLSTRLLLPLGICTLPAFLLLGVAPMLLSVLSTANPTW